MSQEEATESVIIHFKQEDEPGWISTYPTVNDTFLSDEERIEEDAIHTENYTNHVASSSGNIDHESAIEKYDGIKESKAKDIVGNYTDKRGVDHRELVSTYTNSQLNSIRRDMRRMVKEGHVGGTYSDFRQFTPVQVSLMSKLDSLYYEYESPFAINNSSTGTGKSLMGLGQAIMSGCENIVIIGPSSSEGPWRDAVRVLPQIKASLEEQFQTTYQWPDNIWYTSSQQLRGLRGKFSPMLIGGVTVNAMNKHKVISERYISLNREEVMHNIYTPTGESYPYGIGDSGKPRKLRVPPNTLIHSDQYGNVVNDDGYLVDDDDNYINEDGKIVRKPVRGTIATTYRRRAHPEGTTRRMIEDGLFYIYDEFHGAKNDTLTSRAIGVIPGEIIASRGGIKDIVLDEDVVPKRNKRPLIHVPFRGEPFSNVARTGRSRILLMSATISDRNNVFSIGRVLGLYIGQGAPRTYINKITKERTVDDRSLIDTCDNLGFYMSLIEERLRDFDPSYNSWIEYDEDNDEEILYHSTTLERPRLMKYLTIFRRIYCNRSVNDNELPKIDVIVRSILGDQFFVGAASYDGKHTQTMNDLIISLDSANTERKMIDLVADASKFFIDKDGDGNNKVNAAIKALIEIEKRLIPHAINQIIELLRDNPTHRCVIGLHYNAGIARIFNVIKSDYLKVLNIKAPLLLTGNTDKESRPYVNALFQHDLNYRLLIANADVIKQSISLHPLYEGWFTTIIVPIPRNAVDYYQIAGRVLRHGAKADSRFLVISPGMRHSYRFDTIDRVMAMTKAILRVPRVGLREANDLVVELIIDIHQQLKEEYPELSPDVIHQDHTLTRYTEVEGPFHDLMYDYFLQEAYGGEVTSSQEMDLRLSVNRIIDRYKSITKKYPISLVNLIRMRNRKTENLQSVTSENRELPKSGGYIEQGLLSAFLRTEDKSMIIKEYEEYEEDVIYHDPHIDEYDSELDEPIEIDEEL